MPLADEDDEVGEILQRLRDNDATMTELYFNGSLIGDTGAKAFGEALVKNTNLKELNLASNHISDEGAKALGEMLMINTSLIELYLYRNEISDAGALALAQGLKKNSILTSLGLTYCKIGNAVKIQIESLLQRNQQYFKELQAIAPIQLIAGRLLLRDKALENKDNLILSLPIEIKEHIVKVMDEKAILTEEQQRLILNYAEGKIAPVADKLSFFKVTKCDRVMKPLQVNNQTGEPPC